jgi:hypothetical protein
MDKINVTVCFQFRIIITGKNTSLKLNIHEFVDLLSLTKFQVYSCKHIGNNKNSFFYGFTVRKRKANDACW